MHSPCHAQMLKHNMLAISYLCLLPLFENISRMCIIDSLVYEYCDIMLQQECAVRDPRPAPVGRDRRARRRSTPVRRDVPDRRKRACPCPGFFGRPGTSARTMRRRHAAAGEGQASACPGGSAHGRATLVPPATGDPRPAPVGRDRRARRRSGGRASSRPPVHASTAGRTGPPKTRLPMSRLLRASGDVRPYYAARTRTARRAAPTARPQKIPL